MQQKVWDSVNFFHEGDEYFASVISDVRRAKNSIHLETYIFDRSVLAQSLFDEFGAAVLRGVSVRMVVDGFGSLGALDFISRECEKKNISLRIYKPLFRSWGWFFRFWTPNISRLGSVIKNLHRRNHRKVILIDSEIAYVGSYNISVVHSRKYFKDSVWRDTGVRLTGSEIEVLQTSFREVWSAADQSFIQPLKKLPSRIIDRYLRYKPQASLFRINFQPLHRRWLYRDLLQRIRRSEHHVRIVTAYFLPRRSLLRALQKATDRGVKVEIVLPYLTDVPLVKWAAKALIDQLVAHGVKVFEYQNRVLHAKYTIIDQWASVGSLNYNHRSFLHDLEVEAVFENEKDVANLANQFALDTENSVVWYDKNHRPSWMLRQLYRLAFRLRYLL
ncbi:MAG: phosphatidylserine/phosphatidylglycerophosphate/cardiolipin synthase family protein [Bdellovibrionota bacterium]